MLTDNQIETLYRFCKRHYIHFYEVQAELVDHLAAAIEARMEADPGLGFERALAQAYDAFGGYKGLQAVQREKEKQVRKQNWKLKKHLFLDYFKLPMLAFTAMIFALSFAILTYGPVTWLQVLVPTFIFGFWISELVRTIPLQRRMNRVRTPLLLFQHRESFGLFSVYIIGVNKLLDVIGDCLFTPFGKVDLNIWVLSALLTFFVVVQLSFRTYLHALLRKGEELYPDLLRRTAKA